MAGYVAQGIEMWHRLAVQDFRTETPGAKTGSDVLLDSGAHVLQNVDGIVLSATLGLQLPLANLFIEIPLDTFNDGSPVDLRLYEETAVVFEAIDWGGASATADWYAYLGNHPSAAIASVVGADNGGGRFRDFSQARSYMAGAINSSNTSLWADVPGSSDATRLAVVVDGLTARLRWDDQPITSAPAAPDQLLVRGRAVGWQLNDDTVQPPTIFKADGKDTVVILQAVAQPLSIARMSIWGRRRA